MFNTYCPTPVMGGYSLADIAAATGGSRSNDNGFGGDGAWWIIILFLFVFCGWGNDGNGWGGLGGSRGGAADNYVLASDFSNIERKIDGVNTGLCDGFYALNTGILNGFNNVGAQITSAAGDTQTTLCQGFNGLNTGLLTATNAIQQDINAMNIANMQTANAASRQMADCCCSLERGQENIRYTMATDTCALNTAAANNTRDIIESQNANTRAILEAIQQGKVDAMQDKIAELTAEKQSLKFAASQAAQNAYLINEIRPCPVPAYTVPNPYCCAETYYVPKSTPCGCGC